MTTDPATTLAAHAVEYVGFIDGLETAFCLCGQPCNDPQSTHADPDRISHPAHQLAVLAEEGWAIVKLPEAEEGVSTPTFDAGRGAVTHTDDGEVRLNSLTYRSGSLGGVFRSPAKATELAAALLAAARATDGV